MAHLEEQDFVLSPYTGATMLMIVMQITSEEREKSLPTRIDQDKVIHQFLGKGKTQNRGIE